MAEIRIPKGMKDIIEDECIKKRTLQKMLEDIFMSFGYQQIMTPMVEYYETYQQAFQSVNETEMYKFFDQDGDILTLHTDMTVPIARVCASKYTNMEPPFRFFYTSEVFKVRHAFAGKRSQVTDCGIELIGLKEQSDIEVLYIALQVMEKLQSKDYQLEIGNARFFHKAYESLHFTKEQIQQLATLIDHKSIVDLQQYIDQFPISQQIKKFFTTLPFLAGKEDVLQQAKQLCYTDAMKEEIDCLQKLYDDLKQLHLDKHVTFDLGKIAHLDYYTGIIFEGFIEESGASILSGGRYDNLLAKFGRNLPACGFSMKLDYVLDALQTPTKQTITLYYPYGNEVEAIQKANVLRKHNFVRLIPWDKNEWREIA